MFNKANLLKNKFNGSISLVIFGQNKIDFNELKKLGIDNLYFIKIAEKERFNPDIYIYSLKNIFDKIVPDIMIGSKIGIIEDILHYFSASYETPIFANCKNIEIENGNITIAKELYGGKFLFKSTLPEQKNYVFSLITDNIDFQTEEKDFLIYDYENINNKDNYEIVDISQTNRGSKNLENADIILDGGMGLKSKDNFLLLEELSKYMNAGIGSSRPCVDSGLVSQDLQIGQTGKTVKPEICISFGISGSVQHIAGILQSKTIIAINNDKDAPIFNYADYGIISGAKELIVELIKILEKNI